MTEISRAELFNIYLASEDDKSRYYLGQAGKKMLMVIGLNPATAMKEKSDNTITRVKKVIERNYDGFLMVNLYPVRAVDSGTLDLDGNQMELQVNLLRIQDALEVYQIRDVWLAWGGGIFNRRYFEESCIKVFEAQKGRSLNWIHFGELTKWGHPRHPSRLAYSWEFGQFDFDEYVEKLKK